MIGGLRSTKVKLFQAGAGPQELGRARLAVEALLSQFGSKKQGRQGYEKSPIAKPHVQETLCHENRVRDIFCIRKNS